jgi:AcrR family transcriptional regulator
MKLYSENDTDEARASPRVSVDAKPATRRGAVGRPQASDHDAIAQVAMKLFAEKGYESTTMDDIATAVGLGRTTLWRYFPTKSAILEINRQRRMEELREALSHQSASLPPVAAAFSAWTETMALHPECETLDKARMRVFANTDPEVTQPWAGYNAWGLCFVEFVAARRGVAASDLESNVVGRAIWSAIWSAMMTWALSDAGDPQAHYQRAQRALETLSVHPG